MRAKEIKEVELREKENKRSLLFVVWIEYIYIYIYIYIFQLVFAFFYISTFFCFVICCMNWVYISTFFILCHYVLTDLCFGDFVVWGFYLIFSMLVLWFFTMVSLFFLFFFISFLNRSWCLFWFMFFYTWFVIFVCYLLYGFGIFFPNLDFKVHYSYFFIFFFSEFEL